MCLCDIEYFCVTFLFDVWLIPWVIFKMLILCFHFFLTSVLSFTVTKFVFYDTLFAFLKYISFHSPAVPRIHSEIWPLLQDIYKYCMSYYLFHSIIGICGLYFRQKHIIFTCNNYKHLQCHNVCSMTYELAKRIPVNTQCI